jgi:hypothetical protein
VPARAFGLSLDFETPPPGAWAARPAAGPILSLREAGREQVEDAWSGRGEVGWEATIDGDRFVAERGRDGDHRFCHGEGSLCHLSADGAVLLCALSDERDPRAWRVVLDSVLFSVALIDGYEALHAGAVATKDGALAIAAASGGGKSTLLAELLGDDRSLLADDIVVLESRAGAAPLAHPGAPLMTVPAGIEPLPGPAIAAIGAETWVAVPTAREAMPLAGLVVLNRSPGLATGLHRVEDPLLVLLRSLLRFPQSPERERARFELAAEIASEVPVWELQADPSVTPAGLADLVRARLQR